MTDHLWHRHAPRQTQYLGIEIEVPLWPAIDGGMMIAGPVTIHDEPTAMQSRLQSAEQCCLISAVGWVKRILLTYSIDELRDFNR
jgi:hypothetical protein